MKQQRISGGRVARRQSRLVAALFGVPGGAALVITQCRRSLHGLLGRIPVDISSAEEREKVARLYGTPYRDACELLLALMAVDPSDPVVAPLRTGSSSADGFAKLVRQIDARFASIGAMPRWRVRLDVKVPESLCRMSPVAFALNAYLAEGAGAAPLAALLREGPTFAGREVGIVLSGGNIDPVFEHAMGDTDYALRAGAAGVPVYVASGYVGLCSTGSCGRISLYLFQFLLGGLAETGESGCEQQTGDDQSGHSSAF